MNSAFLIKLRVVDYRAAASLRRWFPIDFVLKKELLFFFKQLLFGTFSKKNLW